MQAQQGPGHSRKTGPSRLLRIQKTVDDASGDSEVELLTEIDNLHDVDALVEVGLQLAMENRSALKEFVRHSLFAHAEGSANSA